MTNPPLISRHCVLGFTLFSVVLIGSGCNGLVGKYRKSTSSLDTTLLEAEGYSVDSEGVHMAQGAGLSSSGQPTVVLEVNDGERHMEKIPLAVDKPMFVDDLIRDAKLCQRVGRIQVSIMRQTTPNAPPVRMVVGFDSSGKNVMQEQNYALQPNDRVIVSKDTTSWFDAILKSRKVGG